MMNYEECIPILFSTSLKRQISSEDLEFDTSLLKQSCSEDSAEVLAQSLPQKRYSSFSSTESLYAIGQDEDLGQDKTKSEDFVQGETKNEDIGQDKTKSEDFVQGETKNEDIGQYLYSTLADVNDQVQEYSELIKMKKKMCLLEEENQFLHFIAALDSSSSDSLQSESNEHCDPEYFSNLTQKLDDKDAQIKKQREEIDRLSRKLKELSQKDPTSSSCRSIHLNETNTMDVEEVNLKRSNSLINQPITSMSVSIANTKLYVHRGCISASVNCRVYVWGGETGISSDTSHLWNVSVFDVRTEKWRTSPINGQRPPGFKFCASAQVNNLLYIHGGCDEQDQLTGALYCLDLDDLSFKKLSDNSPMQMSGHAMIVRDNEVYLFGGYDSAGNSKNKLYIFNLSTGSWSSPNTTGNIPLEYSGFSFTKMNSSTIILFGGVNSSGSSDRLYKLNLDRMHWNEISPKEGQPWPDKRANHSACCIGINSNQCCLMISGGEDSHNSLDDMWLLDIASVTWKKMTRSLYIKTSQHNSVVVEVSENINEVIICGGWNNHVHAIPPTTIIRVEKDEIITDSTVLPWIITDMAGSTQLGTRERQQSKRKLYEKEFERAYKKVIKNQLSVLIHIVRLNFVGLPRSGKSTTLRRLIGEILDILNSGVKNPESTGVAERSQVIIQSINRVIGFSINTKWFSEDSLGEAEILAQLVQQVAIAASRVQGTIEETPHESHSTHMTQSFSSEVEVTLSETATIIQSQKATSHYNPFASIDEILSNFQDVVPKKYWGHVKHLLEDTIYLINTDTGGQTEFLDLMSRFLMGPAVNLIISRLVDSLEDVYSEYAVNNEGKSTDSEDSIVTVEEVIFQALASISCIKDSYDSESSGDSDVKRKVDFEISSCSSKVMFVGTFRDEVTSQMFEEKDRLLKKKIEQTEFYEDLVMHASDENLMFALNNLSGGKEEIELFRKKLEEKIKRNFKKVNVPLSWLMLSNKIRCNNKSIMSLEECQKIAGRLGITTADLPKALRFLHYRVGILHYYPEVQGFDQIIICDVKVIFDATTQLVKKTFIFENVDKHVSETFKERAQFTMADLQKATGNSVGDLIPLKKIVLLLEHHKVLTTLPPPEGESGEIVYFMPSILKSAQPDELCNVRSSPNVPPLMFRYECGYLPLGVFSSLITELVSNHQQYWRLVQEKQYRNKYEFLVGNKYDTVTLICRPTFMEVIVYRKSELMTDISSVCSMIRMSLTDALIDVHSDLKYHSTARFEYGFECPRHRGKEHICVLRNLSEKVLLCLKNVKRPDSFDMNEGKYLVWFSHLQDTPIWSLKIPHVDRFFQLIEYYDGKTNKRKVLKIIDELAADWEKIATLLGFSPQKVDSIKQRGSDKTQEQCLKDVINLWLQDPNRMRFSHKYPGTWRGVYRLLQDSDHGTAAEELMAAIEASCSDFHCNFDETSASQAIPSLATVSLHQTQQSLIPPLGYRKSASGSQLTTTGPLHQTQQGYVETPPQNSSRRRGNQVAPPTNVSLHQTQQTSMEALPQTSKKSVTIASSGRGTQATRPLHQTHQTYAERPPKHRKSALKKRATVLSTVSPQLDQQTHPKIGPQHNYRQASGPATNVSLHKDQQSRVEAPPKTSKQTVSRRKGNQATLPYTQQTQVEPPTQSNRKSASRRKGNQATLPHTAVSLHQAQASPTSTTDPLHQTRQTQVEPPTQSNKKSVSRRKGNQATLPHTAVSLHQTQATPISTTDPLHQTQQTQVEPPTQSNRKSVSRRKGNQATPRSAVPLHQTQASPTSTTDPLHQTQQAQVKPPTQSNRKSASRRKGNQATLPYTAVSLHQTQATPTSTTDPLHQTQQTQVEPPTQSNRKSASRKRNSRHTHESATVPPQQFQQTLLEKAPQQRHKKGASERASQATSTSSVPLQNYEGTSLQMSMNPGERKKMNKHELAKWLKQHGIDEDDIEILKSSGVSELLFLTLKRGDKWTTNLSDATVDTIPILQKVLRSPFSSLS